MGLELERSYKLIAGKNCHFAECSKPIKFHWHDLVTHYVSENEVALRFCNLKCVFNWIDFWIHKRAWNAINFVV